MQIGLVFSAGLTTQVLAAQQTSGANEEVEVIEVRGIRRSLEAALNTKRFANSVVDSISAEDIGKMPDKNIAESLQRIPGVAITRNFAGEGGAVSIRGTNSELTSVLLNGNYVASTGWFSQQAMTRAFDMDLMPPEMVAGVDVHKSPTASLDEGGVGGTVVLRTRKPLDLDSMTFFGSVEGQDNSIADDNGFGATGLLSWKDEDERFGVLASFSTLETVGRAHKAENYMDDGWAGAGIAEFNQTRKRDAVNLVAQFQATENLELVANYMKVDLDAANQNQNFLYIADNSAVTEDLGRSPANNNVVKGTAAVGPADESFYRNAEVDTQVVSLDLKYEGDGYTIKSTVGKTEANGGDGGNYQGFWTSSAPNQSIEFDFTQRQAMLLSPNGTDASNHAEYNLAGLRMIDTQRTDEETFAQVDLKLDMDFGAVNAVEFGLKVRDHEFSEYSQTARFSAAGSGALEDAAIAAMQAGKSKADWQNGHFGHSGVGLSSGSPTNIARIDGEAYARYIDSNIHHMELNKSGWGVVNEEVFAAYGQANFDGENFRGNVGIRYVSTDTSADFYDFQALALDANSELRDSESNDYSDWLPSLNLAVDLSEDIILRMSAAKVMSRANYTFLNPASSYDQTTNRFTRGTVQLDPYRATQMDIGIEWYFNEESLLSATLFNKDLASFIVAGGKRTQISFNGGTADLVEPAQGLGGKIEGLEVQYQQAFGDFGALVNFTYADGYGTRNVLDDNGALVGTVDDNLPGLSKFSYNITGYYETDIVSARLAYTYRDDYLGESTGIGGNVLWDAHGFLDASATWHATENLDVSVEATNLLEESTIQRLDSSYDAIRLAADNGRNLYLKVSYRL